MAMIGIDCRFCVQGLVARLSRNLGLLSDGDLSLAYCC